MKISEMTLEQLQDYALKQQEELSAAKDKEAQLIAKNSELTELNTKLQKRNNDLFMQVEQAVIPEYEEKKEEEIVVESCEDFARNLILKGAN